MRAPTQLQLAERFLADGHDVRCVATRSALRFLVPYLIRRPRRLVRYVRNYRSQLRHWLAYFREHPKRVPHIAEAAWPEVVIVAPATCNSIGKLAAGITDNFALLIVRATPRATRVIVVPSMNPEMWYDPQFQYSLDLLNASQKYRVLSPTRGEMLSGDLGFGAQAAFEDIVAETYRTLGMIGDVATGALARKQETDDEAADADEESARPTVIVVDEDAALRRGLRQALSAQSSAPHVEEFETATEALSWLRSHRAELVLTALEFSRGAAGFDLIEYLRRPGSDAGLYVIAMSRQDRRVAGAERLARYEVHFQQKPLNFNFVAGMVSGCLQSQKIPGGEIVSRRLASGEVLFSEGDEGSEIYTVESGRLRVVKEIGGRELIVGTVEEGGIIGEMAFFGEGRRYATALADVQTEVAEIDLAHVRDYIDRQPPWLNALIRSLGDHLRHADEKLVELQGGQWPSTS